MVAFRCYNRSRVNDGGRDGWRTPLPREFDNEVDAALEVLQFHRSLDDERYFKALRGRCDGLIEVRINFQLEPDDPRLQSELARRRSRQRRPKTPEVHIRILGFGTAEDFILLYGFRKRGERDYGPACRSALNRRQGVMRNGRRAAPCRFP
jgi:hypothetical protein